MAFTSSFSSLRYLTISGAVSPAVPMGNVTLAGWWRLTNLALASELVEVNDATFVSNLNAAIFMNGSQVAWSITNAAGTRVSINPANNYVPVNTWTHLGLTWDGTTIRAYVNGVQVQSVAGPAGPFPNWSDPQIGPAEGQIQDAVFFDAKLSDAEMAALFAKRMPTQQRANLQMHIPIFTGSSTNWGKDYSGTGRNFSNVNTPTDGTSVPPASWGDDGTQVILLPDGDIPISGSGLTQTTGSAALTAAAGLVASGLTQTTGAASLTAAAALVASGLTQTTGSAALTAAAALVASGLTQTTGAATFGTATFPIVATGTTQTTGSAAMTAAAALVASGLTQTTGTATLTAAAALVASGLTQTSGSAQFTSSLIATGTTQTTGAASFGSVTFPIVAAGLTQTTGAAALTASAPLVAAGLTKTTGTAAMTAAAALVASGLTQTTGSATMTAAAALVASGLTQTTGSATLNVQTLVATGLTRTTGAASFAAVTFPIIASGVTQTTGAAVVTAFIPYVEPPPQALIRAPRETIWITSNPFNPTTYASVLGSKLVDMWHSESGISLDASLNVQSWAGVNGLVLTQTLGAGRFPLYGTDGAFFNGRNVVQCRVTGLRCLAYKPGVAIFNAGDRPGLVHVSRYVTVPGAVATTVVNMGAANAPTPPAIFQNDFFDGTIVTTGQRRQVVRTPRFNSPFGITNFESAPVTTTPRMGAFGLTSISFDSYLNGQLSGSIANNENLSESWDQLTLGATAEVGTGGGDVNVGMVFLLRNMLTAFEALQLYYLAQAEWGL